MGRQDANGGPLDFEVGNIGPGPGVKAAAGGNALILVIKAEARGDIEDEMSPGYSREDENENGDLENAELHGIIGS
jgi:hypothetical protein